MSRKLPSLAGLRAFEAAARLSSFTRAAQEIGTTQPGVSRLIRLLEEQIGQVLFVRFNRRVELTASGRKISLALTESFDTISDAITSTSQTDTKTLSVIASSGFNPGWLIPILAEFEEIYPSISIRLSWSSSFSNIVDADYDVALRVGGGQWPGIVARKICDQILTPLCSPDFLLRRGPLLTAADLLLCPLVDRLSVNWAHWFAQLDIDESLYRSGPNLDYPTCNLHREAALNSLGVALLTPSFYRDEISKGRLLQPFETLTQNFDRSYWITYPEARKKSRSIQKLSDWVANYANTGIDANPTH